MITIIKPERKIKQELIMKMENCCIAVNCGKPGKVYAEFAGTKLCYCKGHKHIYYNILRSAIKHQS